MLAAIAALPRGRVTRASPGHDPFPGVPDGIPVRATVEVRHDPPEIEVDLRENVDCTPTGLNLSEACARTSAMIAVFNSLGGGVPANAGSFRRISVLLRENCAVGIPRHPASCSAATTNLADRVQNVVQRALADLGEGVGMAEFGPGMPPAWCVVSGIDPRSRQPFVNQLFFSAVTGGAASPHADGWLLTGHAGNAGMMFRDSVELDELRFPLRVFEQRIVPDSEGAGRHRGAPGALVEYGPEGCAMEVLYPSDGTINPAQGTRGGLPGAPARQYRRRASGELEELPGCGHVLLQAGERIISISSGGGGYGPPHKRSRKLVEEDLTEGWITPGRAKNVYGFEPPP